MISLKLTLGDYTALPSFLLFLSGGILPSGRFGGTVQGTRVGIHAVVREGAALRGVLVGGINGVPSSSSHF